jgi:hypothetical protein
MVKVVGPHHVRAMRAFVRRKLAQQQGRLAREKEAAQKLPLRELPEYDPDDTGRFAGYDAIFKCEGPHYEALCRVLKKILRPAHYRTWAAANGELVNSPTPCLAAKEIAERVGRHRRTIEIDLQEMREKRLLHLQPAQREGRWVMEMHFDVLYRLVHEYLEWERSSDSIPPERQYFERIEISADLRRYLLQFEDYRKVLAKKKPGPKAKSGHPETSPVRTTCTCQHSQHTYSDASILPAAYQGGMTRSVNLELPAPPALPQAGVSESILPMAELEPEIRRLLDPRASEVAPAMPEENEIGMRVLSSEPEEDEPQEHDAQPEMTPVERYDDAPDRTANQEARDDREAEKPNAVALSSVFSYGSREIVHGGAAGAVYPAIVPLLRDFMQKKLLGGDTATRYFVAYERLEGSHIERAFPPGSNGVWLWRDRDQLVHVKPTCSSLDPALKNRNLSSLSVAVGKLADDDGRFYFDKPRTDGPDRPSTPPGRQNVNDDRTPRAAPPDAYAARGDDGYNGKAPIGAFQAKIHRRRKEDYSGKGPPGPAQQQAQERYNALLKQAKDGRGKGLQRLF